MMNNRTKALFEDLGKPTMRGIRKCPKCGIYNGTRGMSCKNKSCNLIFKEPKSKKKITKHLDCMKLLTGSDSQIYSVKIRDKGLDLRGFVLLPVVEGLDELQASLEMELIIRSASQCHISSCPRSKEDFTEVSLDVNACRHITSAIATFSEAVALTLKDSVLDSMMIADEVKQAIWQLANETSGPLVQRVSKSVMVVKCKDDDLRPLGFVHCYFFDQHRKQALASRTVCECEMPEVLKPATWGKGEKCIHYNACMCAILSDRTLEEEFRSFIESDNKLLNEITGLDNTLLQDVLIGDVNELECVLLIETEEGNKSPEQSLSQDETAPKAKKKKELIQSKKDSEEYKKSKLAVFPRRNSKHSTVTIDENEASFSFVSWLGSVTERINQAMHFKFTGKPEPLVFHAPQIFFDCLQQRISTSTMRKRVPNASTTFTRKDILPLGVFHKYTWHIASTLHVKQIFDTPEVPLLVTRSFVENKDGTYDTYDPFKNESKQLAEQFKKTNKNPLIQPSELKTFLKVGKTCYGTKESSVMTLEWIPNILPSSGIGELRISFEFGHLRNGRVEVPPPTSNQLLSLKNATT